MVNKNGLNIVILVYMLEESDFANINVWAVERKVPN